MSGMTPYRLARERLPGAAHAALHLVEDQQRADLVAAAAQRGEELPPRSTAPADALHGLDDHRRRRSVTLRGDAPRGRRAA